MRDESKAQLAAALWEKVESRIAIEECTKAFMTQGLDQCGAFMCLAAFQLVNDALDDGGRVRRLNKSENTNLASILKNEDGPWMQRKKNSHQKWDYMNTWIQSIEKLGVDEKALLKKSRASKNAASKLQNEEHYYLLSDTIVFENFCERDVPSSESISQKKRKSAKSTDTSSMNVVDSEKPTRMCVRNGILEYEPAAGSDGNSASCHIRKWETEAWSYADESLKLLEPYWMYDLHDKRKLTSAYKTAYGFQKSDMMGTSVQRPDVVLEVTYKRQIHTTPKKIVVIAEIDGDDKTYQSAAESLETNPVKLAVKAMQSTSVQAALQENSYHIRSNFYWYLKSKVDMSLLGTTNVNIPDFQELMRRLQCEAGNNICELEKLTRVIHLVGHLYRAHVKVAFLIYMKEVHDIDMREILNDKMSNDVGDVGDQNRMVDHHFFINFQHLDIPADLCFAKQMQTNVKLWLQERRMLQSRLKIKCFDNENSKWVPAPIMQTETTHSNMLDWKARVVSGEVPLFPSESAQSVPITYATIQRVNMQKLCEKVRLAATTAYEKYKASQRLQLRKTRDFEILRREFPDRCYLTRSQQLDADQFWNQDLTEQNETKPRFKLRKGSETMNEAPVESNSGYEVPGIKRNYKEYPNDMKHCNFDQIDVRMHYIHQEMKSRECMESASGMWYTEDYVLFFEMLRSLKVDQPCKENERCTDAPVLSLEDDEDVKLSMTQASCDYRFCFYELDATTCTEIEEINACYYTKKKISEDGDNNFFNLKTMTFEELAKIVKNRQKSQDDRIKLDCFLKMMTNLKILIPFADDSDEEWLSFAKVTSFKGKSYICTLLWPYYKSGTSTGERSLAGIIKSFELFAQYNKIETNSTLQKFFDECLRKFKEKFSIQDDQKTIDQDLTYDWEEDDFNFSEHAQTNLRIPIQTYQQDLAYHIFSVLSYFFDCRDDGACRYQWEESLLDYFGGGISTETEESSFHKFRYVENHACDYKYYNEKWFQMCFFMEHNFRNAISAIHYKLFDVENQDVGYFPDHNEKEGLHTFARKVYERENNFLATRASFVGLRNVSPGLSFKKHNSIKKQNVHLRDLLLSQLDDELPHLDPVLAEYVRKFRIPDSELFLRIIRCPNILALQELAKRHFSSSPVKSLTQVLEYFDPAIQSELEAMLRHVRTDDSVYIQHASLNTSSMSGVTQRGLLECMRQAVGCTSLSPSLGMIQNVSPLQCKYDMFLNHTGFHVLAGFFCKRVPSNHGTKNGLRRILTHLKLMDTVLRCENVEDCEQANDNVRLILQDDFLEGKTISIPFQMNDHTEKVSCVIGTSRRGWPKRDINKISIPDRSTTETKGDTETPSDQTQQLMDSLSETSMVKKENSISTPTCAEGVRPKQYKERDLEMHDEELRLWMLLAYARPCPSPDSTVSITQENFIHKGQQKGDCENVELHYDQTFRNGEPVVSHVIHTCHEHMFFERCESAQNSPLPEFPEYTRAVIPDHIDRMQIYIPKSCAQVLRRQFTNTHQAFKHQVDSVWYSWRPVFAGVRTWCWKRFLVKTIFLHAVGQIMVQTRKMLSMICEINDGDTYLQVWKNKLSRISENTHDASENLPYKMQWFPYDIRHPDGPSGSLYPVLTLHTYKTRILGRSNLANVTVCSPARRQHTWLEFIQDKNDIETAESCRFMRLDKRQTQFRKLDTVKSAYGKEDNFFSHGEYIYFLRAKREMYVNIKDTIYVKFPTSHAIRTFTRVHGDKETLVVQVKNDSMREKMFCTMFDTRRYEWSGKIKCQKSEDDDIMNLTTPVKLSHLKGWRPVEEGFSNRLRWAYTDMQGTAQFINSIQVGYKDLIVDNHMLRQLLDSETKSNTLVDTHTLTQEVQTLVAQVDSILNEQES